MTEAIFVGCNKELQIFDYNHAKDILAYGAKNSVAISSALVGQADVKVERTLQNRAALVSCIKWIPKSSLLLSGSADGTVTVWELLSNGSYKVSQTLETGHKGSVTCIGVVDGQSDLFAVGCGTGSVQLWRMDEEEGGYTLENEFLIKDGFYPMCLTITAVGEAGEYVLFIGGTKTTIFVYTYDGLLARPAAELPGHEDWVKALAVKKLADGEYLAASGSQDKWIRLWKLRLDDKIEAQGENTGELRLLENKQYKFEAGSIECAVNFDAIIMGHDDWISDLRWHPTELRLLSSSADSSIMIWQPDEASGVWITKTRLGEMSIKGASTAAGASGGFWCAGWIVEDDDEIVLTNSKTGSFRVWSRRGTGTQVYEQLQGLTGPVREVTDVQWSPSGKYLLATSLDQTTRLFAKWTESSMWHEFARPQIHGYDMICAKAITESRFVSAGDEKVIRIFDEPKAVADMLGSLTDVKEGNTSAMPESASLPVLGLSNKAENDDNELTGADTEMLAHLDRPPLEDHLQRFTLWPEVEKLYGHGFEVTTVDVSPDGKLIASACRSNVAKHAVVRLFQTSNWQQLDETLPGHDLTITRVRFSPEGGYILSVSRDRKFALWRSGATGYDLVTLQEKAHARIIWDCCWVDETRFVTGSRDRKIKLWKIDGNEVTAVSEHKFDVAVTALDSTTVEGNGRGKILIAVGLDNGSVWIYSVEESGLVAVREVDHSVVPKERVARVSFQPGTTALAVASDDYSVRIVSGVYK